MRYRAEIDGLRAIAVLSVILFHAGVEVLPGGFVGVDIFFVISGYLITSLLLADLEKGQFSLWRFYERRARRILPALFFVLLCCLPFAWVWLVPPQLKDFSQAVVAVVLMISNFLFWRESSYFEPSSDENLLLHTWSLAVEEQFYLFFPLILFGAWRLGRRHLVFLIVALLSVASLLLSEWLSTASPSGNFYLMPTRAWELGAGVMVAMLGPSLRPGLNNLASVLGLLMIIVSILALDESVPFPSSAAIPPVLGAALIILYGRKETVVARLLSAPVFVGLGLISYSAYLWHQPLFALARVRSLEEPKLLLLALVPVSLVLAVFSWRFIEQPFRTGSVRRSFTPRAYGMFACLPLAIACTGMLGHLTNGGQATWQANNPLEAAAISFLNYGSSQEGVQQFRGNDCFFTERLEQYNFRNCLEIKTGQDNYLLLGDSHAAHFSVALQELYRNQHLLQATAAGCRPLRGREGAGDCLELYRSVFEFIAMQRNRIDGIIMSANWRESEIPDLRSTLSHLQDLGIPVAVFGPTVQYSNSFPIILARLPRADTAPLINRLGLKEFWDIDAKMADMASEAGVDYVPVIRLICPGGNCRNFARNGQPMQFDYGHYTLSGARTLLHGNLPADIQSLFQRSRRTLKAIREQASPFDS